MIHLKQEERDKILGQLSEEQRTFLIVFLKRGKKTEYANVIAKEKATDSHNAAYEWEFEDYIDAGPEWHSREPKLLCECGRTLRHQYIVKNNTTGEIKKFGITHFEYHVGFPPHLAREIKKGLEKIDLEIDELLIKIKDNWSLVSEGLDRIPDEIKIPNDIQDHLDLGLPLLERQVKRLKEMMAVLERNRYMEVLERRREEERKRQAAFRNGIHQKEDQKTSFSWPNKSQTFRKTSSPINRKDKNLTSDDKKGIIRYLQDLTVAQFKANEVCEYLIVNYGVSPDKYSSGTYQVFGDVCVVLQEIIQQGAIEFIQKDQSNDRLYQVIDKGRLQDYKADDDQQISLF